MFNVKTKADTAAVQRHAVIQKAAAAAVKRPLRTEPNTAVTSRLIMQVADIILNILTFFLHFFNY